MVKGFIYLIESSGWVKIGISHNNIDKRIDTYFSHNPCLKVLKIFKIESLQKVEIYESNLISNLKYDNKIKNKLDWFFYPNSFIIEKYVYESLIKYKSIKKIEEYTYKNKYKYEDKSLYNEYMEFIYNELSVNILDFIFKEKFNNIFAGEPIKKKIKTVSFEDIKYTDTLEEEFEEKDNEK